VKRHPIHLRRALLFSWSCRRTVTGGLAAAASLALALALSTTACKKAEAPAGGASPAEIKPAPPGERPPLSPKPGAPLAAQVALKIGASAGMRNPRGIAIDGTGNLYVVDAGNARVLKFDPSGKLVLTFGKKGSGQGQFQQASHIALSREGNVLVLDGETSWIQIFTPAGKPVGRIGGPEMSLYHPSGLAVGTDGTIFVVDTGGNRVLPIGPDGKARPPITSAGKYALSQPTDIYLDPRGGLHIYQIAGAKTPSLFFHLSATGELEGQWLAPDAPSTLDSVRAVLASDGRVFATDPQNQTVRVYDADGASYRPLHLEGDNVAPFRVLSGIALDAQGHVYVADGGANVVYRLQLSPPATK
jgi:DNA-binding beta-propeller fold protein YncE